MAMIPVTYLSGATLSNTLGMFKRGTIAQNLKTLLESGYKWWSGIDIQSNQYLIYSDTYTMGTTTQANATPVAWSTPDLTDTSLLNLINTLPPRVGKTPFTSLPIALQWLQSSNQFFLIRTGTENIVKSGLQLYVDAGRYNSYSGTGTNWVDLSGEGNNSTLINGTIYNSSGVASMYFDGTDDYVESINNLDLSGTNPRTYSVWVKIKTYLDNSGIIRTGTQGTASADMSLETTTTPGTFTFNGWVTDFDFTVDSNFYGWHNLVIVYDGTKGLAYADGIFKNSLTFTSVAPNSKLQLGSDRKEGAVQGNNLDGFISNAMVYNRALSDTEILQNFNAQKYRFGYYDIVQSGLTINLDTTNYLSYPRSGNTWTNLLGNNINATLENSPTFSGGTIPSISFDGSDEWAVFPSTSAWGNNPFTLISWCYPKFDQYSYGAPMLTKAPDCSGNIEWALEYGRDSNKFSIYGGGPIKYTTNTYPKNNWYHATSVYDGTNLSFYINGQLDSTHTGYYPGGGNGRIAVGTYYGCGPVNEWFGNISEAQVYTRALSGQEVLQNYESKRLLYGTTGVTTSGLTLNLDAANYASYGGVGTVWKDISGNGNDGTLINGPTYGNSGLTSNISFDGADDYVNIGVNKSCNRFTSDFTVSAWVNRSSGGGTWGNIIGDYYTNGTANALEWQILIKNDGYLTVYNVTNGYVINPTPTGYGPNTWINVVLSRVGSTLTLYANTNVVATTTNTTTFGSATGNLNIGIDGDNSSERFTGRIANVLIYKNKGLNSQEVLQNYNAQKSRFGL
jgi:hypothetical protein